MRILITGATGFIGGTLAKRLAEVHNVVSPDRSELDLTVESDVADFFSSQFFDVVIHCAVQGGKSHVIDGCDVLYNNLRMFTNILKCKSRYTHLIHFTSGYELEPNKTLETSYPSAFYNLSKNILSRWCLQYDWITNIRIFGIFGESEYEGRFIKKSILDCIDGSPIHIFGNRLWDYIYIEDLVTCVEKILQSPDSHRKNFDLVYPGKKSFLEIAEFIKKECDSESEIIIHSDNTLSPYIGNAEYAHSLLDDFIGVDEGLRRMIKQIR